MCLWQALPEGLLPEGNAGRCIASKSLVMPPCRMSPEELTEARYRLSDAIASGHVESLQKPADLAQRLHVCKRK